MQLTTKQDKSETHSTFTSHESPIRGKIIWY